MAGLKSLLNNQQCSARQELNLFIRTREKSSSRHRALLFPVLCWTYSASVWKPPNSWTIQFSSIRSASWSHLGTHEIRQNRFETVETKSTPPEVECFYPTATSSGVSSPCAAGVCVLPACFAVGTYREAAGAWRPSFIISLSLSLCLWAWLYSAEVPVAAEAQWPAFTALLLKLHTHKSWTKELLYACLKYKRCLWTYSRTCVSGLLTWVDWWLV